MVDTSMENAWARSASVRRVWALGASFQLADVALGISQIVRQFCLAPSAIDTQPGNLSADSFT
jgi:hypothetical protein